MRNVKNKRENKAIEEKSDLWLPEARGRRRKNWMKVVEGTDFQVYDKEVLGMQ